MPGALTAALLLRPATKMRAAASAAAAAAASAAPSRAATWRRLPHLRPSHVVPRPRPGGTALTRQHLGRGFSASAAAVVHSGVAN